MHIQAIGDPLCYCQRISRLLTASAIWPLMSYRQLETMDLDLILLADFVANQKGRHVLALITLQLNNLHQ